MRVFQNANYKFLSMRRPAYFASAAIITIGLLSIVFRGGLRTGVEFTGGVLLEVQFSQTTDVGQIRDALTDGGTTGVQIQQLRTVGAETYDFLLRVPVGEEEDQNAIRDQIRASLETQYSAGSFEIARGDTLSAKVGDEFQRTAVIAVLLSFLLTLIYLAFRFEWRFGVAAVIATVHDMLITFGFISLFDIEINLATVAAILTIIGYSLNDTIVVFDRVRENLRKKRKEPYDATLNRSLNETLPRTVLTSGTTLIALFSLVVIGGAVIRPFAGVLIIGVLIGTYSSIFVASPVLLEIHDRARRRSAIAART
ncbi:MAG: protein translocase subunit SecF [Gemmatimonadales bacterium]|uniref:protein translocase subunit SecF n=1 Tax=Candidatus Palauibacter irciniicola TaxID=3056733 RepID=UPI001385AC89|nr:protein translocase subunit SecF [Candidatus Palauibacter irciniicola]MYC18396.1 protein translocase subunit SecF [Gemmatimonadales bacterium]